MSAGSRPHLVLYHSAEVVVAEEDAQLLLLHGGRQLAQPVVRELGGRGLQELLSNQPWGGGGGNVRAGPGRP